MHFKINKSVYKKYRAHESKFVLSGNKNFDHLQSDSLTYRPSSVFTVAGRATLRKDSIIVIPRPHRKPL